MENNMFGRKLAPKNQRICKGCPPKVEPFVFPKFRFTPPVKEESTRVVNVVDMKNFKKKTSNQNNILF